MLRLSSRVMSNFRVARIVSYVTHYCSLSFRSLAPLCLSVYVLAYIHIHNIICTNKFLSCPLFLSPLRVAVVVLQQTL
jgi:hypothetical protein